MLVDSHCHLDFPDFAEDLDGIVSRARAAGIGRMVTISTRVRKLNQLLAIAERYDDVYDNGAPEAQARGFRAHIAAARATGLPLVIHTREADEDCGRILEEEAARGSFRAVLHCYTGGRELALKAVSLGLYIGFTGILTFKKSEALRALAAELPSDRILVETDSPYLAPGKFRGKRNEP